MDDPIVLALHSEFSDSAKLTSWVKVALGELRNSIAADVQANRLVAYMSRMRQLEELYFRALYVLFIATPDELPHVLSGDPPNGFSGIYRRVNKEILGETGVLYKVLTDPTGAEFTAIRTLNESTHGSLRFLLMCAQMARNPKFRPDFPRYFEHVDRYWAYLNYMEEMFRGGKTRADVLVGVRNMHKPRAAWTTLPGVSGADVKP